MEIFGLSPIEMVVIFVVAILVFGQRLPQVAGEAAATLQKIKRSLSDLRRETGIDQEIQRAKREFEQNVRKPLRDIDVPNTIRREAEGAKRELQASLQPGAAAAASAPPADPAKAPTPPAAADPSGPDRG